MSNIVVSEEQILNAEECRVIQRTNLRNQGVGCKDNESMRSLVGKTANIQSWVKVADKTLSGVIYDDTLTTCPTFQAFTSLKGAILTKISSIVGQFVYGASAFEFGIFPQAIAFSGSWIFRQSALKTLIVPRISGDGKSAMIDGIGTGLKLIDFGSINAINADTPMANCLNFKYFILRKSSAITTLDNTSRLSGSSPFTFVPQAQISNYESGTNWSATSCTFLSLEGSRFEDLDWWEDVYNQDGTPKNTCTLDGNLIETADNETVAIFKHTENISHCYENGVELQDTDLVKGKTLTSTI